MREALSNFTKNFAMRKQKMFIIDKNTSFVPLIMIGKYKRMGNFSFTKQDLDMRRDGHVLLKALSE